MSVTETISFDKDGEVLATGPRLWLKNLFLSLIIILTASLAFGVGRLTAPNTGEGIKLEWDSTLGGEPTSTVRSSQTQTGSAIQGASQAQQGGEVVVSKNGSKYHYPHCSGAKQIKEENKVFFPSGASAEASGYTLAANCSPR